MISKDKFVKIIGEIKSTYDFQDDINKVLDKYNCDGYIILNDCSDATVTLLREMFHDTDDWIGYFVYELDFGKNPSGLVAEYKNGDPIDLSCAEKLYDFLIENMETGGDLNQ